jgi:hypothetical protein
VPIDAAEGRFEIGDAHARRVFLKGCLILGEHHFGVYIVDLRLDILDPDLGYRRQYAGQS